MPLVGTWIEIGMGESMHTCDVVPLVGTWIEITCSGCCDFQCASCPSWARGLKYLRKDIISRILVVPLVGTWIEILFE